MSQAAGTAAAAVQEQPRRVRLVFGALMLVLLLAALDQTVVATALPTIVGDLGNVSRLSWVVTAYLGGTTYPWGSTQLIVLIVIGVLLLAGFVFAERQAAEPILPLESAGSLYERLAARAGVDLPPPQLWLLARLGERAPTTQERLLEQLGVDAGPLTAALQRLRERSLVADGDELITLTPSGRADYERLVTARCAGLRELLDGWNPDEHPELGELIDKLGRDLVSQIPTPVPAAA
jgi:DNA-binding MarR family transcriptional regulator